MSRWGKASLAVVMGAGLIAVSPTAQAADDRQVAVERVLAAAPDDGPLEVVTTRQSADGPVFTTSSLPSRAAARRVVAGALAQDSTVGVDVVQQARAAVVDDTYRPRQWALDRLEAETVWRKTKGRGVVVAVVDSGVRTRHADLRSHLLKGRDFASPGTPPEDTNGHGTHVTGIITAVAGNHRGVAGLAPATTILPVRVLDRHGEGGSDDVARGIVWAADQGADVINLSLTLRRSDTATKAAVAYAISKDVVVVAAAGNNGCSGTAGSATTFPAAYPGVIGVGALNQNSKVASYSSCGSFVDVVAPGSGIISTMIGRPAASLGCGKRGYCTMNGTSMAAPYVSASAALLIARMGRDTPASQIAAIVTRKADDLGVKGWDRSTGAGCISPKRMLYGH